MFIYPIGIPTICRALVFMHSKLDFSVPFATDLSAISTANRTDIQSTLDSLTRSPDIKHFWILSRQLRVAPASEIKPLLDPLMKVIAPHRSSLVSAAFAGAHWLRAAQVIGQNDSFRFGKGVTLLANVFYSVQLYNAVALPGFAAVLPPQFGFLDVDHEGVQRTAAAAIARTAKSPAALLKRVLVTIGGGTEGEGVGLPPAKAAGVRTRGMILLAGFLATNAVLVGEYLAVLIPILENEGDRMVVVEAQMLLSRLMVKSPTAFHGSRIVETATALVKRAMLITEFLKALLVCFGIFAIRRFVSEMIPHWIGALSRQGIEFIEVVALYANWLEPDLQLELQSALVEQCEKHRFDVRLFETTAMVLNASSPTVSPFMARFMEAATRSAKPQVFLNMVRPLLEPRCPPILHPLRTLMKVKEVQKMDAFTQAGQMLKSVNIQCDRTREIRTVVPQTPIIIPLMKTHIPIVMPTKTDLHLPIVDLDTVDLDVDLSAPPDPDE
jgi:hypothetical protein